MVNLEIPNVKTNPDDKTIILVDIFLVLFIYKGIKLMNIPESDFPIVNILFSKIIFQSTIIFLFHQKDLIDLIEK